MSLIPDFGDMVRQAARRAPRLPGAAAPVAPRARDVANRTGRWTWEGYTGGTVDVSGHVDVTGDGQLGLFIDSNQARFDVLRLHHEGGAVLDCYRDGHRRLVRAGTDPEPGMDNPDDRAWNAAVAQLPAVAPLARVAHEAAAMLANFEAGDSDDDGEDLFYKLAEHIAEAAAGVGLGPTAQRGDVVDYDPDKHWQVGAIGAAPDTAPAPGTKVRVVDPGQQWDHGAGGRPHVFRRAFTVLTDDEHGDHYVTTPAGLDEEPDADTQSVWVEMPDVDALLDSDDGYERADHPEHLGRVPAHYNGPDWYVVDAVGDCDGDDGCPNGTGCTGRWLFFDGLAEDGGRESAGDPIHYERDAKILLAYDLED